jgi:hypothetical protein
MKATLALLVYTLALSPAQMDTLPPTLPTAGEQKAPGLPVPLPNPAGLATPAAKAQAEPRPEEAPQATQPLRVPLPEPIPAELPAPALPPLVPPGPGRGESGPTTTWSRPTARWSRPAENAARLNQVEPRRERLPLALRPAGPAGVFFVLQDVHGAWPTTALESPTPAAPPPLVRASSHPLPPAATVLPVIYTTRDVPPPAAAEKGVIVQTRPPREIAWGARDEYRQIVGQLVRVHVHGGRWVVRYASLDQEDRYGGSVVLDPEADLGRVAEGDVVCVRGAVLNGGRAERPLGAPLYRVQSIERLGGGTD